MVLVCAILSLLYICVGHGQAYPMRWCTTSAEEQTKCGAFIKVVNDSNVEVSCVQADSVIQCMEKIENGDADLITLDGGEVYLAGKKYGMVPVVNEQYGYGDYYFAVAVAKLNSTVTMKNLKGKKTCHTGAGKTSGWVVPIGFLLSKQYMKQDKSSCNPYISAGNYFKESCIPNVKSPGIDTTGKNPMNLCEPMCPSECKAAGKYSGYSGAFKCLMDGVGEVAFVKHTTVMENVNASDASNYRYLCNDGSRAEIGLHVGCHLAVVPSHAVMTKSGNSNKANYVKILMKVSDEYGVKQNDSAIFQLFNSKKYGGKDLMFKDSTIKLGDVSQKTYQKLLGDLYMKDLEALDDCVSPTAGSSDNKPYSFLVSVVFMFVALVLS